MSGDQTQGKVGPDGRFAIHGLTPGEQYVLYIEEIVDGGFPTAPMMLISEAEYWNVAEDSNPAADGACDATPIAAQAGATHTADITFNGYDKGVTFTPIVSAFLTDLAKNGRSSAGVIQNTAFLWDQNKGFTVLPAELIAGNGSLDRNGRQMLVQADLDGNGIHQPVIWSANHLIELGDLNGDTCGGSSQSGVASYDGSRVALGGTEGVELWNPHLGTGPDAFTNIGTLRWCHDIPYLDFGLDLCETLDEDTITDLVGPVPVLPFDMSDDGTVIIGRAGGFFTGFESALWIEGLGWTTFNRFLAEQGVVEAGNVPFDNPAAISASGTEVVGGIAGAIFSWLVDLDQVYVCENGVSVLTGFPDGLRAKVAVGAVPGRCEHLDG